MRQTPAGDPDVFFLPLAVPDPDAFGSVDAGVLARRLPDFLHQMLNQGSAGPTALLEIQTPPEEGPIRWVLLDEVPDVEEAFDLLPDGEVARAVVTGQLARAPHGIDVALWVHAREGSHLTRSTELQCPLDLRDPVPGLRRLAERVARAIGATLLAPPAGLLTSHGGAFLKFLEGLDAAAVLSGDVAVMSEQDGVQMMRPFVDALALDPRFGLALRTAQVTIAAALEGERMQTKACVAVLDACFTAAPGDGEGCVAVAEQLAVMGDEPRALAWLQHATHLDPPPARGLENLGILFANRGDTVAARNLWLQGVMLDGHPDFFAHLSRLAFGEGDEHEAWDKVIRGLRRIYERRVRAAEWDEDGRGIGVLLCYLVDHLGEVQPPEEVVEALCDLGGVLADDEDRVDLGLCLLACARPRVRSASSPRTPAPSRPAPPASAPPPRARSRSAPPARSSSAPPARPEIGALARTELEAGLAGSLEPAVRDRAVRAMLILDVPQFERRFARAVDAVVSGKDPGPAMDELQSFLAAQPSFWPALFFFGVGLHRLDASDQALDVMAEVLRMRPGQPDVLNEMALLFDERGNAKRALECVDEALVVRPDDAGFHANRATFLEHLGRHDDATTALDRAIALEPRDPDYRRLRRRLR